MKKNVLATCLWLLCLSTIVSAQTPIHLEGGINYNFSNYTYYGEKSRQNQIAYFIAALARYKVTDRIALIPELQYSIEPFTELETVEVDYRAHYIRLIPHVEYSLNQYFSINAGFNIGYEIYGNQKEIGHSWLNKSFEFSQEIDYGLSFGARCYLDSFVITFKYYDGVQKLGARGLLLNISTGSWAALEKRNRMIQLGGGYIF